MIDDADAASPEDGTFGASWPALGGSVVRLAVAALIWGLVAVACGPVIELDPPDLDAVPRHVPEQTFVYDADGNQIAVLRQEFRELAAFDDLPEYLVDAVVTAEDRRFWVHAGVDARAMVRAALANRASGEIEQGGSTITQQLVKNVYMPDAPRTPGTKFREALLARRIEDETSKERILEDYLNTVYFGNGAYGVRAAAFTYFREPIEGLDLAQSTMLAALIRSPESLQPARDSEGLRARRDDIIDRMVVDGLVDLDAATRAKGEPIVALPRPPTPETTHPHWVDFVVRELLEDPSFGATESERATRLFGGGLRIHTTLHPDVLATAETARDANLPDPTDPEVGIAVVVPDTGEILALVGGRDYQKSQFDLATQGRRQPGSTFKTFVLAAALQSGYRPDSHVNGNQTTLDTSNGPWTVRNFSRVSYGPVTLEEATRASVNAVFARLILELGPGRVATLARAMGIESPINEDPPIAIGGLDHGVSPLDMAAAYATLANLGERVPVSPVDRIENADGKVVWRPNRARVQVLEPSAAFVTTQMLRTVVEDGTGTAARVPGWEVAGKTGTVDDHTDAWFVGYTPTISVAVWVGDAEERVPLVNLRGVTRVTGGSIPARIWRDFVSSYLTDQDPVSFVLPQEYYQVVAIDPVTGLRSAPWCASEERALPRVLVPQETCPSPPPPPPPPPSPPPPCPVATESPAPAPSPRDCVPVRAPTESPLPGPTGGADEPEDADDAEDEPPPEAEPDGPGSESEQPSA